jgi:hypothetical protein
LSDKKLRGFHSGLYADKRLKMIHKEKEVCSMTLAENYKTENWPE